MSYFPYLRGKQNELILVRECAPLLERAGFVPVIEPVKESTSGLIRTAEAIGEANAGAVLILNPHCGLYKDNSQAIAHLFANELPEFANIEPGILLSEETTVDSIARLCDASQGRRVTMIHAGFPDPRVLVQRFGNDLNDMRHIFREEFCGKLYQRHFGQSEKVLIRDGFGSPRSNRKYEDIDFFSDLHVTYALEGMQGFGDFLIVGKEYSDAGGPAYAVAIHITCIDHNKEDRMFVHHFKSIRQDTPTDPAGKFAEALQKLEREVLADGSCILRTDAINEFLALRARAHYPGLGYVKKLSMMHHLETIANFFFD